MLKYSVKFSIKNNSEDQPTPLRMRVSYNAMRVELYPRINIKPSRWDDKKKRIKGNAILNNKVTKIENVVIEIFEQYELLHKRYPTKEELKELFAERMLKNTEKASKKLFFYQLIEYYIDEKSPAKQWSKLTLKKYEKLRNHAYYFDKKLEVKKITAATLRDLMNYFKAGPKDSTGQRKAPHRNTTIKRDLDDYKRILKWGRDKGYYNGKADEEFEQTYKGTKEKLSDLVYLEWDELIELFYYDFSDKPHLGKVRDVFCFCCFTSLRFSDVENLKKTDIKNDKIHIATKKTTDPIVIELNDYAKIILNKYKDVSLEKDLALPVISMTRTNIHLKEIGNILEFNTPVKEIYFIGSERNEIVYPKKEVLSTHAARRTFVINALKLGIPSEVIIKWTGHKDFENLKPYVKIVDELKENEMNKFNLSPFSPP